MLFAWVPKHNCSVRNWIYEEKNINKNILRHTFCYATSHDNTQLLQQSGKATPLSFVSYVWFSPRPPSLLRPPNESPGKRLICILITDNHYWSQTSKKPRAEAGVESGETNKQEQPDEQIFWWKQRNTKGCNRTNTDEKSTTNQSLTLCPFSSAHIVFNHIREWGILFCFFFETETNPPSPSDSGRWSEGDQIGVVIQFVISPRAPLLHCTDSQSRGDRYIGSHVNQLWSPNSLHN